MSKEKKVCLEDSQVKRLGHDAYMLGKHGDKAEGICDTVAEIVKDSTTTEERIGKLKGAKKKKDKSMTSEVERFVVGRVLNKLKTKWDDFF